MAEEKKIADIVVIGGGPAGYLAAIQAARCGASTTIIEKDVVGGTCLNRGCIPTKYYLKSAEMLLELQKFADRGITIADPSTSINMKKAVKGKNKVVRKLTGGVKSLLISNGVTIINGTGKMISPTQVEIDGKKIIETKAVILAGGSKAIKIPIPGVESSLVLTSDEILDLETIPKRLTVIGGGVIGIEMGLIFHSFGSEVSIVELDTSILPFMDKEVSSTLAKELKSLGISINTGVKLEKIVEHDNMLDLNLSNGTTLQSDLALLSIGRGSDLSCIGVEDLAIERGKVVVNDYGETNLSGVYAIGDINGKKMLAHAAYKMGEKAAKNACAYLKITDAKKEKTDLSAIPSVVYSVPEVGSVGLNEDEARASYDVTVGKFPLAANGRALATGTPEGFVKVIADTQYGKILGVHIVGHNASEIINEAAVLMTMEITVHEVAESVHGHPTIGEAFMEASADCLKACLHLPPRS